MMCSVPQPQPQPQAPWHVPDTQPPTVATATTYAQQLANQKQELLKMMQNRVRLGFVLYYGFDLFYGRRACVGVCGRVGMYLTVVAAVCASNLCIDGSIA